MTRLTQSIAPAASALRGLTVFALIALTTSCHPASSLVVCGGGAKLVGGSCYCPLGTTLVDGVCRGTPQAGICTGNAYQVQEQCFCPDGTAWQDASGQCMELNCYGGALVSGNTCVCPQGTVWRDEACQLPLCAGGAFAGNDGLCYCAGGSQWDVASASCVVLTCGGGAFVGNDGQCYCAGGSQWDVASASCVAITTCTGGAYLGGDNVCYCPAGTVWDGAYCAAETSPVIVQDLCYDLDCNGSRTGRQCFDNRTDYCASLCASDNCLAPGACQRNCR